MLREAGGMLEYYKKNKDWILILEWSRIASCSVGRIGKELSAYQKGDSHHCCHLPRLGAGAFLV